MMETREAYYERVMPILGITEVAQMQFNDNLSAFFKAVSEYSNTVMSNQEALYDKDICPDLEIDGRAVLELMGNVLANVPSYISRYAVLRELVQAGLLTEREYSLIEEGRIV